MKDGCAPEGSCGACTVLIDGRAVVSCAQKATRVEGKHVVTHEGLSTETRKLWADCFAVAGASQCGFCSPGIVMKAEGLLAKNPAPGRDDVAHALLGNLCRCTGYVKVIDAVLLAAAARRGEPLPEPGGDGVGQRALRYRADELALGDKPFVADLRAPGMLHGALRFSDHPRARVIGIDTAKAEAHPGVIAVLTAADVPGRRMLGSLKQDWRQLVAVGETTSYVGDVIACIAAETRHAAREAAELVEVEYEVLEPVTSPAASLAADAPQLHADGNILSTSVVQRGDADAAIAGAAHVVTRSFRTQFIEHAFLEPEASLAVPSRRRAAAGLLAGAGRVGRPPADRAVPRRSRRARARHPGVLRRRVRRQGGPERAGPRRTARRPDGAARAPHALAQGEPALPRQAARDVARLHGSLRSGRPPPRRAGPHHRRYAAPTRASATRCSSARRDMPAARTGSTTSTSRRRPSTRTIRRAARCAASASTSRTSRWKACSTSSPSSSGSTGGRSAGATRSTRETARRPGSCSAPVSGSSAPCTPSRTPTATPRSRESRAD